MSFTINNNVSAMNANLNLTRRNDALANSLTNLSSGLSINKAADNASGLAIANNLSSQFFQFGQSMMNMNDTVGMLQTADGAMQGISDNTDQIGVLALKASNATLSDANRASIQKEIDGLMKSSDRIANSTSFNGIALLNGSGSSETSADARVSSLFTSPIDVTTQESAMKSLESVDAGRQNIDSIRSSFGAVQNRLESDIRNTSTMQINAAFSESQIRDVDMAAESANFSKANMLSQIGSFVQSQSNASAANVTRLLQ